ncbi:DUF1592 domain-containing protein [Prosthecobacter sp.]|uniref:DUF1592 domain-containing protein n=1 Tax=Prosthecobacter sp. TaxID=1965333 RepID=UPI003784F8F3
MLLSALPRPFVLLPWFALLPSAFGAAVDAVNQSLAKELLPVIEQRCTECHDEDTKKGDISFEFLRRPGEMRHDIRLWGKVREQIRAGTMPPKPKAKTKPGPDGKPVTEEEKPTMTDAEREVFLKWIQSNEGAVLEMPEGRPGVARSRRMNREEYNNTLRDLLGIAKRPGDKFPADGAGGEGFANSADTLSLSPLLVEKYLGAADDAMGEVWQRGELRQRLYAPVTSDKLAPDVGAEMALRPFLLRAFRRPPTEAEVQGVLNVFRQAWGRKPNWDEAMKVMFKAVLVSPGFLFIEETARSPEAKEARRLGAYEMASHLSYFLWSSMPDEELLKLAAENKLQDDAVLEAQVRRMMAHEKGLAFTKNFAGQWLRFDQVFNTVDPDRRKFPDFNGELRQAMYDEIFGFCDHLLRRNGRVLDFLDSDYSFLNEALAKVYEVPGVQGKEMRQVKFTNARRGGLTGMAAILASTAYPQRTSPVLRGKWVLEQLLGTPPPPPPANVGALPEDDRALKETTLRKRLEAHRNKPACAGCHTRLDPPGFALENFDPIGKWRDNENGKPLDATGVMPGGKAFGTPQEFRKLLMEEKSLFVRSFCTRLLGYATGRTVELGDQPTLLRLEKVLRDGDFRSEVLILALVKSSPFRSRL